MSAFAHEPARAMRISSGALEAAKWIALAAMLADHVNAVFFDRTLGTLADVIGRIAMPLFAAVLAYNLARPTADYLQVSRRLLVFGVLATPVHAPLFATWGEVFQLNILFTFMAAIAVLQRIDAGRFLSAGLLLLVAGCLVDFMWAGIAIVVALVLHFRKPTLTTLGGVALAGLALCVYNGNLYALLAVPVLHGLSAWSPRVPRLRWAFWAAYPGHLALLLIAARWV